MKTAVETVFVGKDRLYNRRFLQMCSHYLVDPVACTPASGWEKGQVENQVGLVRQRFFTPRLRFKSYDEMNAWLTEPYAELPDFLATLSGRDGVSSRALEFTILTAARTGEVVGATWDEINLETKTWTVPAGRIKGGREHRVPLSDRALEILNGLPSERGNPFVFIGPTKGCGLSDMALNSVLRRMHRNDITTHGFRSSFRDWAAEETHVPNHVVEMALAHTIGNAVEAAYRRGDLFDKRIKLMADWSRFCMEAS